MVPAVIKKIQGNLLRDGRLLEIMAERDERWWPGEQQDAQEFLQALLEALQVPQKIHSLHHSMTRNAIYDQMGPRHDGVVWKCLVFVYLNEYDTSKCLSWVISPTSKYRYLRISMLAYIILCESNLRADAQQ